MSTFDIRTIDKALSNLSPLQRAAFAVACAERLFAIYRLHPKQHPGEIAAARAALDYIWDGLRSGSIGQHLDYVNDAEKWLRDEDATWHPLNPLADNSIAATIYACRCFESSDADSAKWAAVQLHEAIDYIAQSALGITDFSQASESAIQHSSWVLTELDHQRSLLAAVQELRDGRPDAIDQLKEQSMNEAADIAKCGKKLIAGSG